MRTAKTPPAPAGECWLNAPLPCLAIDRRGRISAANPPGAALFEAEAGTLAGRDLQEFFSPVPQLAALLRSRKAISGGEPIEGFLARPAGAPRPVALRLQRLGAGRGSRLLAWVLDRTEVQELQHRLERS